MNEYEAVEENSMPVCCLCGEKFNLDSKFTENTSVGIQCNPEVNSQGVQCEPYFTESKSVQCGTEVNSVVQKCVSYSSKEVQCDLINLELLLFKCKATQWENEYVYAPLHGTQPDLSLDNSCETKTQFVEKTHSTQIPLKEEANNDARSITSETTIHIGNSSMSMSCSSIEVVSNCNSSQSFHSCSDLETCKKSVQKKEKKIDNLTKKTERYENEEIVKTNLRKGDCCVTIDDAHDENAALFESLYEFLNNHQNCRSAEDSRNNESKIVETFGVEGRGMCTSEDDISSTEDLAEKGPADQSQLESVSLGISNVSAPKCFSETQDEEFRGCEVNCTQENMPLKNTCAIKEMFKDADDIFSGDNNDDLNNGSSKCFYPKVLNGTSQNERNEDGEAEHNPSGTLPSMFNSMACECLSSPEVLSLDTIIELRELQAYCTDSHLKDLSGVSCSSCDKQMENNDLSMTSKHTEKNILYNQKDPSSISHTNSKNTTKKMNKYKRCKKSFPLVCYSDSGNTSPENDNMLSVSEEHNRDSNNLSENRSDEISRYGQHKRKHQVKDSTTPGCLRDEREEKKYVRSEVAEPKRCSLKNIIKKRRLYIHHTDSEPEFIDCKTEFSDAESGSDISSRNRRNISLPKITNKLDVKSEARKVKNHVPCDIWDSDSASDVDYNSDRSSRRTYQTSITRQSNISRKNRGRRPYSKQEDNIILQYIIERKVYKLVKGKALWEEMEKQNICDRTWQSMKEHFRRQILPNIKSYHLDSAITKKFQKML